MEYSFYDTNSLKNTYEAFLSSDAKVMILPIMGDGFPDRVGLFGGYPSNFPISFEIEEKKDIQFAQLNDKSDRKLLLVRMPDPAQLTFAEIRQISEKIGKILLVSRYNQIFTPILGASQGVLPMAECCWIMITTLKEQEKLLNKNGLSFIFLSTGPAFREKMLNDDWQKERRSAELAFLFSLEHFKSKEWLAQIKEADQFYFELGRIELEVFINYKISGKSFYADLLTDFKESKQVFQVFIKNFDEKSEIYEFLRVCGGLIAHIDRNAYNKSQWNNYKDKRTMAMSGVNQTQWTENLLRYKAAGNELSVLSPSVRNAFNALLKPADHLTMLSEQHREKVSTILLGIPYDRNSFEQDILGYFETIGFSTRDKDNRGVLASRVLYAPEIKKIWLPDTIKMSRRYTTNDRVLFENLKSVLNEPKDELIIEAEIVEPKSQLMRLMIHADSYAEKDLLNYKTYAEVIAAFLLSDLTKPPLTIGILAPWGKGKTTLMRFIEEKLKGYKKPEDDKVVEEPKMKYRELWEFLKKDVQDIFTVKTKDYPVVWFNAWKFQKNEQVWAGLAHEIITQLANQLPEVEREKFWLRVNLKRVDKEKIRRDIVYKFINKLFFPILFVVIELSIGLLLKLFQSSTFFWLAPSWSSLFSIIGGVWICRKIEKISEKPPETDISKYILQPEYKTKMGYYSEVESDLRQALQLISNKDKPPIIFIDDLDRCSPVKITELIEAINLFISGDINTCYFVIGLDAQIVSAALDVTYQEVGVKTANMDKHHGSIGWYFMEKFLQLQFHLPVINNSQSTRILRNLLQSNEISEEGEQERRGDLLLEYSKLEEDIMTIDDLGLLFTERKDEIEDLLMEFAPGRVEVFQQKVIIRALNEYDVLEEELASVIEEVAPYISVSPRMLKRFANLFIFYRFIQYTESSRGLRKAGASMLGNWLLIMIRWPQLVRAIQWDTEKSFLFGEDAVTRAAEFQQWINIAESRSIWLEEVTARVGQATWQTDLELYTYFTMRAEPNFLKNAVLNGLW